jgi:hypothetical protein
MQRIKERRLNHPRHIKTLMQEQINALRHDLELDPIQRARAIAYLASVALTAMREGELEDRLTALEERYNATERGARR